MRVPISRSRRAAVSTPAQPPVTGGEPEDTPPAAPAGARSGRLFARALLPLLVLALGVAALVWLRATREVVVPEPPRERVWPVQTVAVVRGGHQPEITAYGQVVAGRVAALRPLVAGELVEVSPRLVEGAAVAAGEALARIDAFDYQVALEESRASLAEARARVAETLAEIEAERSLLGVAEAQLALWERERERSRSLKERGTASDQAYDEAALAVEGGRQAVIARGQTIGRLAAREAQEQAALARAEAAVARAERDLQRTLLLAPFTGWVSAPAAALGQRVSEGDQLAELIDVEHLEVTFELLNADFARLVQDLPQGEQGLLGRPLTVHWRPGEQPFSFAARVERVAGRIDASTGGVELRARFEALDVSTPIRPGAFVELRLPDRYFPDSIELPASAVREDGQVYVVEDERLVLEPVRVLRRQGDTVLVQAELPLGARVVARAFPEIGPGVKVTAP